MQISENFQMQDMGMYFHQLLDGTTGVRSWKGIPYARQPTGPRRWKKVDDPAPGEQGFFIVVPAVLQSDGAADGWVLRPPDVPRIR